MIRILSKKAVFNIWTEGMAHFKTEQDETEQDETVVYVCTDLDDPKIPPEILAKCLMIEAADKHSVPGVGSRVTWQKSNMYQYILS